MVKTDIIRILISISILMLFCRFLFDFKDGGDLQSFAHFRRVLEQPIFITYLLHLTCVHTVRWWLRNRLFMILHFNNLESLIIRLILIFTFSLLMIPFGHKSFILMSGTLSFYINFLVLRMGLQRFPTHLIWTWRRIGNTVALHVIISCLWHISVIISNIWVATIGGLELLILHDHLRQLPRITKWLFFLRMNFTTAIGPLIFAISCLI